MLRLSREFSTSQIASFPKEAFVPEEIITFFRLEYIAFPSFFSTSEYALEVSKKFIPPS